MKNLSYSIYIFINKWYNIDIRSETMLKSMTSYGSSEYVCEKYKIKFELKSVNNRYFDLNLRSPRSLIEYEDKIRLAIKKRISRAKIDCFLTVVFLEDDPNDVEVDLVFLRKYMKALSLIKEELGFDDEIKLEDIISQQEVLSVVKNNYENDEFLDIMLETLEKALDNFDDMRIREGENLKRDILNNLTAIEENVDRIKEIYINYTDEYKEDFMKKYNELIEDKSIIDEKRLEFELALLIDKYAIDEEIVRMYSHISQFKSMLNSDEAIGKKMDFLIQEMNRESNTILSKTKNIDISKIGVEQKNLIEKIREQIQNIE